MRTRERKELYRNSKGITLIALIITVVVLLILTAITINSIQNDGIIGKAEQARDDYQAAQANEAETLLGYGYMLESAQTDYSNVGPISQYTIEQEIKKAYGVDMKLGQNVKYSEPTTSATSALNESATLSTLNESGNGEVKTTASTNDVEWAVLGIEDGCLLIVATSNVEGNGYFSKTLNGTTLNGVNRYSTTKRSESDIPVYRFSKGKSECLNNSAANELNTFCANNYGKGVGALGARSISVDDINKITGYNPMKTGDGRISQAGAITQYDNEVTYKLTADGTKIGYTSDVESNMDSATLTATKFEDIYGNKITDADDEITIKNTYYWYRPDTLSEYEDGSVKGISKSSALYRALFDNTKFQAGSYWLASPVVATLSTEVYWGLRAVFTGNVGTTGLWCSWGTSDVYWMGVRPVVKLKSSAYINFTQETNGDWTINTNPAA